MLLVAFVIGIGLVGLSVRLALRAVLIPRMQLRSHLRDIAGYGFEKPVADVDAPLGPRLRAALRAQAGRTGRWLMRVLPGVTPLSQAELNAAGYYDVDREVVHGYRAFAAVGLPFVVILLILAGGAVSGLTLLLVLVTAVAGWMGPSFVVRKRGAARLQEIDAALPELIDLLIATIEAGMGFTAAVGLIAERMRGPLGDELRLTMKQQSLGMSIQGALSEMVERCDTQSVRSFVRTAGRGDSLGVSIGPVLRELSADQRRRRRMTAREKMQKAPVKMIFPMMFLIFPALFIVLFYPALYTLTHNSHLL